MLRERPRCQPGIRGWTAVRPQHALRVDDGISHVPVQRPDEDREREEGEPDDDRDNAAADHER